MQHTKESLELVESISNQMENNTFHHHYYVLMDIANTYNPDYELNYAEIGCYAGGSSCLMLQRPSTNVIAIDLGHPIDPLVVHRNVAKFNIHNNEFEYLQGNSQTYEMVDRLAKSMPEVDILFIDGDHSYQGVINDFLLYSNLVKQGGYIIFDDYNDAQYSPEVKIAVDDLVKRLEGYEVIGTLDNVYGARPAELLEGNEFIIRKL